MGYYIKEDEYVTSKAYKDGQVVPVARFTYSIRRSDDSLVFRASSLKHAEDLLSRLERFAK